MVDLVTSVYKGGSLLAQRLPGTVVERGAPALAVAASLPPSGRRAMVERHQRRIDPSLHGATLRHRVRQVYRSYGRYYSESFRLPAIEPADLDARLSSEGYEHVRDAIQRGIGPVLVLPHLGSWEWCAYWLTRVEHTPVTAVVERLDPPALFDWFVEFRQRIGIEVVPLGADAGPAVVRAVKQRHVVPLLADRDITGGGAEVWFLGERTTLPSGPAVLALRTGAPLLPTAVYDTSGGNHHAVVRPPIPAERQGRFREDVVRITQTIAHELEELIRRAPDQWHLMQPNWPSDRDVVGDGRC